MLIATQYLGTAAAGATRPQLFRGDDGRVYVVKLQNNRLGPKVLANEYIGDVLGTDLGLCFPPGSIIRLEDRLLRRSRWLRGVPAGRHFACLYLSGTQFVSRYNVARACNLQELAGVMLFDNLVQNVDRTLNWHNLLLRRETGGCRVYAIDNSHLFWRAQWTAELLERLTGRMKVNRHGLYGTLLRSFLQPADFAPYLTRVRQWTDEFLEATVEAVPGEWLPHAEERQAAVRYLKARRDRAEDVVSCLAALTSVRERDAGKV